MEFVKENFQALQHANAVHQGRTTLSQEAAPRYGQTRSTYSVPRPPEHDEIL